MTKLYCAICQKKFENTLCSPLKLFLIDSLLCNTCKETNSVRIIKNNINIYSKIKPTKKFVIDCGDISPKYCNYFINVSKKDIIDGIKRTEKSSMMEIKIVFGSCLKEILKYEQSILHQHYMDKTEDWKNWCNDIVIYYICRKKIFGKPIPISCFDESNDNKCNCSYDCKKEKI